MLNVIDSCGWIEYFVNGRNANKFAKYVQNEKISITPTIVLMEVYKWILRNSGEANALTALATMKQGKIIDLNSHIAVNAAENSHVLKLSLADSIIYTIAQENKALLITQNADMEALDGVQYIAHPDRIKRSTDTA